MEGGGRRREEGKGPGRVPEVCKSVNWIGKCPVCVLIAEGLLWTGEVREGGREGVVK
jgi:hypothetical protein